MPASNSRLQRILLRRLRRTGPLPIAGLAAEPQTVRRGMKISMSHKPLQGLSPTEGLGSRESCARAKA